MQRYRQLFTLFILYVASTVVTVSVVQHYYVKPGHIEAIMDNAPAKSIEREKFLKRTLECFDRVLDSTKSHPALGTYLQRGDKTALESLMFTQTAGHPLIMQLHFIDAKGFETVRIERAAYGDAPIITTSYQDKSKRDYFIEAKHLTDAQVGYSTEGTGTSVTLHFPLETV
jgi:Tfp pilus assembly major pilin PilA